MTKVKGMSHAREPVMETCTGSLLNVMLGNASKTTGQFEDSRRKLEHLNCKCIKQGVSNCCLWKDVISCLWKDPSFRKLVIWAVYLACIQDRSNVLKKSS